MKAVEAGPSATANMSTKSTGVGQHGQMDWSQEGRKRKIVFWHKSMKINGIHNEALHACCLTA